MLTHWESILQIVQIYTNSLLFYVLHGIKNRMWKKELKHINLSRK